MSRRVPRINLGQHGRQAVGCWILAQATILTAVGQERRAPPPRFERQQWRDIFFDDWREGIRGQRPPLAALRGGPAVPSPKTDAPATDSDPSTENRWVKLISPASLEDEVKRLKIHFDAAVTTPSAFKSGGFQTARVDLSALAALMAVIAEYDGAVRWQAHAGAARDLLARTAANSKAGSTQVYNEVRLRQADLQDLLAGSGLSAPGDAASDRDWSQVADRGPLMEYAGRLIKRLEDAAGSAADPPRAIARDGELLAMLSEVFVQPGMEDADDGDYVALSRALGTASSALAALGEQGEQGELAKLGEAISGLRQRCDACHQQYR